MEINIGDTVQLANGAVDVISGETASAFIMYGQGGPLWLRVMEIHENWFTDYKYGLPEYITKVTCKCGTWSTVWEVRDTDISENIIRSNASTSSDSESEYIVKGTALYKDENGSEIIVTTQYSDGSYVVDKDGVLYSSTSLRWNEVPTSYTLGYITDISGNTWKHNGTKWVIVEADIAEGSTMSSGGTTYIYKDGAWELYVSDNPSLGDVKYENGVKYIYTTFGWMSSDGDVLNSNGSYNSAFSEYTNGSYTSDAVSVYYDNHNTYWNNTTGTSFDIISGYAPHKDAIVWSDSVNTYTADSSVKVTEAHETGVRRLPKFTDDSMSSINQRTTIWEESYNNETYYSSGQESLNPIGLVGKIYSRGQGNVLSNEYYKKIMLNDDTDVIQNADGFPIKSSNSVFSNNTISAARYDYSTSNPSRYSLGSTLETQLQNARASLGIPVHGHSAFARHMKYYMYNRFKVHDTNMAFNRTITHVFFTRPDLNLLGFESGPIDQVLNHSESSLLWRMNPTIFKMLTDSSRCGDNHNFNLLFSNQINGFTMKDETLTEINAGKSWNDHQMMYGDTYSGRTSGELNCSFTEVNDLSIIHTLKLWMVYIDNVSRGVWSPAYNLFDSDTRFKAGSTPLMNESHIYTRTLDYAASCYVFKCAPDGETVLYWSKYFGIFPVTTGINALDWKRGEVEKAGDLNIAFKYSFKRDMSPVSLIEFNSNANISSTDSAYASTAQSSFASQYNHSSRPFVGCPYIELDGGSPSITPGMVDVFSKDMKIRLKYKALRDTYIKDEHLFRANM